MILRSRWTNLICIRQCLGFDELNTALAAAKTAMDDPNVNPDFLQWRSSCYTVFGYRSLFHKRRL